MSFEIGWNGIFLALKPLPCQTGAWSCCGGKAATDSTTST